MKNLSSLRRPDPTILGLGEGLRDALVNVIMVDPGTPCIMPAAKFYKLIGSGSKYSVAVKLNKRQSPYDSKLFELVSAAIEIACRWSKQPSRLVASIRKARDSRRGRSATEGGLRAEWRTSSLPLSHAFHCWWWCAASEQAEADP